MITVLLNGGLGNQMFQYAAARRLALKHQTGITLDLTFINSKLQIANLATYRKYELGVFDLPVQTSDLYLSGKYLYPLLKTEHLLRKFIRKQQLHPVREKDFSFDESILHAPDNSFLEGNFQSEKYFKPAEDVIREDFKFKNKLTGKNLATEQKIIDTHSVSIHIRRGDYVKLEKNQKKHGATSLQYYSDAIQYIAQKISEPHFFVFTDDVTWARENFKTDFPFEIVDQNKDVDAGFIDMQLMSYCRHNIICNSTFSWWGAWLNGNEQKIVVAPQHWFADMSINSKDIYPSEWIKL